MDNVRQFRQPIAQVFPCKQCGKVYKYRRNRNRHIKGGKCSGKQQEEC